METTWCENCFRPIFDEILKSSCLWSQLFWSAHIKIKGNWIKQNWKKNPRKSKQGKETCSFSTFVSVSSLQFRGLHLKCWWFEWSVSELQTSRCHRFFCCITVRRIQANRTTTWLLVLQSRCQNYITVNPSVMGIERRAMEVLLPFLLAALLLAVMVVNACEVGLTALEPDQTLFISFTVWKLDVLTSKVVIMPVKALKCDKPVQTRLLHVGYRRSHGAAALHTIIGQRP